MTRQSSFEPADPGEKITGYQIGAIGRLTQLHARVYAERCEFDARYEVAIARELADFIENYTPPRDGFWLYKKWNAIIGAIAVDGSARATEGAQLKFLIVDPQCQGRGIGRALLRRAIDFCQARSIQKIFTWSSTDMHEARGLYEKLGFIMVEERPEQACGKIVIRQKFVLNLNDPGRSAAPVASYGII